MPMILMCQAEPRTLRSRVPFIALVLLLLASSGCDPGSPGVGGRVFLGGPWGTAASAGLRLSMVADIDGDIDFAQAFDVQQNECTTLLTVSETSFPVDYQLCGSGLGVSDATSFRVVAWLSFNTGDQTPRAGDLLGEVMFAGRDCGATCGVGRACSCGVVSDVDVVLDQVVQ